MEMALEGWVTSWRRASKDPTGLWYEWKTNYISVNIQGYFSGSELLKVTLYYAMGIVEPMLRNLLYVYVYVYKYLFQEALGFYRISLKEQLNLS